jgi:predicted HTH domain antitoxin
MKSLSIKYPESVLATLNLSTDDFEKEAKLALAVKLFELGRLTSGQASQLAEVSRFAFLLNCGRYGAPSVQWDDEELKAEFGDRS